jgi:mannose-6-phosphate isomerase-like protein (cupin superfamily)
MILARNRESSSGKGWYDECVAVGLPAIGFATRGIDEPHHHRELREVYLVARGSSLLVVDDVPVSLCAGDVVVVEPGEVHTFVESTPDYFHFVLHCPAIRGDKVAAP